MTILTKPNVFVQIKKEVPECPGPDAGIMMEEDKVEMYTPKPQSCRGVGRGLLIIVLALLFIYTSMYMIRQCLQPRARVFTGYCSIPIDTKQNPNAHLIEPNFRMLPLRWSPKAEPEGMLELATDGEDLVDFLREELRIGDSVERITVYDSGRTTSFVHDFSTNMTGIVDLDRCFTMELDPALVMPPSTFILNIEAGREFDVSRVRSSLRAVLPALPGVLRAAPRECADKPVYLLRPETEIRKRSAEEPGHFMQFAGHRIQEIEISNLAEVIRQEQGN